MRGGGYLGLVGGVGATLVVFEVKGGGETGGEKDGGVSASSIAVCMDVVDAVDGMDG